MGGWPAFWERFSQRNNHILQAFANVAEPVIWGHDPDHRLFAGEIPVFGRLLP
jgi:hypothetical protein